MDWFQQNMHCCGINGPTDWHRSNSTEHHIPKSCCIDQTKSCRDNLAVLENVYTDGCVAAGEKFLDAHIAQVAGVGVGIAVVQLLVFIAACCLCRAVGDDRERIE